MSSVSRDLENEIKNVLKSGKAVLGINRSLKAVMLGRAKAVIVASKIPKNYDDDIRRYANLSGIPVINFSGSSRDLGLVCGKPFPVSAIAILDLGGSKLLELSQSG
ncbi:MAG: 50S ribosomal protein L30e [Sulfolobales archaeon]|nr:50S ribosomal protein L30e [Sulfolobales archaeon]MCX8185558.1 50S ribosomal protein L30e [Sulfolobales archaeon]MDW7969501.1 50S ribosomal protein L30e [Sulfolobales archaeon]